MREANTRAVKGYAMRWVGSWMLMSLAACSLGDAASSPCDPAAGPGEANACQQVSACDDGNGYVNSAVDGCCEECAVRTYESCVGKNISILSDFCGVNKPGNAECCARATAEQTSCEAGVKVDCDPTTAHSTEPTTGAGGSTAAGTGGSAATAAGSGGGG